MAKWKCEICGNEFDNFHAQGFDNKIYCPLCYFKKENQELKKENKQLKGKIKKLSQWDINKDTKNSRQRVANAKLLKENIIKEVREYANNIMFETKAEELDMFTNIKDLATAYGIILDKELKLKEIDQKLNENTNIGGINEMITNIATLINNPVDNRNEDNIDEVQDE